jgi:hypothetical protein
MHLLLLLSQILQLRTLQHDQPVLLILLLLQVALLVPDVRIEVVAHRVQPLQVPPQNVHMTVQVLTLLDLGFQFLMQFELLSIIIIFK